VKHHEEPDGLLWRNEGPSGCWERAPAVLLLRRCRTNHSPEAAAVVNMYRSSQEGCVNEAGSATAARRKVPRGLVETVDPSGEVAAHHESRRSKQCTLC
jgi:hypothetical protein